MGLPSVMSSTLETRLRINVLSRDLEGTPIEVSYLPSMYIPTREIIFLTSLGQEVPVANLDIYGLPHVLEHIIVSSTDFKLILLLLIDINQIYSNRLKLLKKLVSAIDSFLRKTLRNTN